MSLVEGGRLERRLVVKSPLPSRLTTRRLARARNIADLRRLAQQRLPRAIFDFIDGGSEDEVTLRENQDAFRRVRFSPKTLVDVSNVNTKIDLLGQTADLPVIVGPTGASGFVWPNGDLALARAAAKAGIPFALSTSASVSIEEIAAMSAGRRWFQCYIFKQREFTMRLIERALRSEYDALVVTVDFPVGGNRERDHRNDFSVPFRYSPRNIFDFAVHPGWASTILQHGIPKLRNLDGFTASNDAMTVASSVGRNYDASFSWDDLKQIRDSWPGKLIVKGIVRPDDADKIVALGADALVVSNHGGRQLDGGIATLDALPAVSVAVNQRITVLVDGGIRRGSDVVKAIALGANAVLLGRASLYGLCAGGEAGAQKAIDIVRSEMVRTMQLCGIPDVRSIGPDALSQRTSDSGMGTRGERTILAAY
ncbi:MAG: lldA [Bryobacterales bacterium]|jgi:(S)-mandelate dehydrogenase|nr:lldA [Bryobacterales bacterium]